MVPDPETDADTDADADAPTSTAREFAERFLDEDFADAVDLLADDGRDAVVDAFPDGFQRGEMDAEDALKEFWYGLYGQYGAAEGVGDVTETNGDVTVDLRFVDGSHDLELAIEDGAVVDFALPSEYEPPSYADPESFTERDVTVDADDVDLDGVLAVPDGDGPFPGVVLVHGAGLHDHDGTAGNSKILKDFAWGLASDGVAVLRYEKRLNDHEVADENYTFDEVIVDDAVAAVDELASAAEVDDGSLFVAGHSQGSWAAPRVADYCGNVAGVVALDGSPDPSPDEDEDFAFLRYSIEPDGDLDEDQREQLEALREPFERIAAGDYDADEELMGKPGRWHDSLRDCDPVDRIEAIDAPAFVAKSGRADPEEQPDIVAMHEESLAEWRDADLGDTGRVEFYEDVGHYFQTGHDPTSMAHLYFADNAEEYVVADVAAWIHEVTEA